MLGERDKKLEALGYPLDRLPPIGAIYTPVIVDGTTIYTSGCIASDGPRLASVGKVPSQVSLAEAQQAAALCAANVLRNVRAAIGSLDRIDRVLKMVGYVNSDSHFTDQHLVINGASELLLAVLGEAGKGVRTAIGMHQLPRGTSTEVDMVLKLKA